MSNRLKALISFVFVVSIVMVVIFAIQTLPSQEMKSNTIENQSMSSEDLMAYLHWKHIELPNQPVRISERGRVLDYHSWKDQIESQKTHASNQRTQLMSYLQWKHRLSTDIKPTLSETERLLKYLAWKHIQDPGN